MAADTRFFTAANLLVALRLVLGIAAFVFAFRNMFPLAAHLFLAASLTDLVDGIAARHWETASETGGLLDAVADTVMVSGGLLVLLLVGRIPPMGWVIAGLLAVSSLAYVTGLRRVGLVHLPRLTGKTFLPLKRYHALLYTYVIAMFYGIAVEMLTLVTVGVAVLGTYLTWHYIRQVE